MSDLADAFLSGCPVSIKFAFADKIQANAVDGNIGDFGHSWVHVDSVLVAISGALQEWEVCTVLHLVLHSV